MYVCIAICTYCIAEFEIITTYICLLLFVRRSYVLLQCDHKDVQSANFSFNEQDVGLLGYDTIYVCKSDRCNYNVSPLFAFSMVAY